MSSVSSISPLASASNASSAAPPVSGNANVDKDQFLNLLVNQLKNQNPMEPVTNEQFIGQLAQFQSLETQQKTNASIETLINLQAASATISHLTEASSLIGKKIEYEDMGTGEKKSGVVSSVGLENGAVVARVGENAVPILLITSILPQE
jgi:flagellar basal-body rod modification protein FlgD